MNQCSVDAQDSLPFPLRGPDPIQQQTPRLRRHVREGLAHRRQPGGVGLGDIIESGQGDVVRHGDFLFLQNVPGAEGHMIVGRENGRGGRRHPQELGHGLSAPGAFKAPVQREFWIPRDSLFLQSTPITFLPIARVCGFQFPRDKPDAPMSLRRQVHGHFPRGTDVV